MSTKTQLWRGGLADIVQRAKEQLPDSLFITREQERSAQEALVAESKVADCAPKSADGPPPFALPPSPGFGRTTLVGHALDLRALRDEGKVTLLGSPEMRATRVVPIESLLVRAEETAEPPALAVEPSPGSALNVRGPAWLRVRPTREQVRRALMVLLALVAAVLFALPTPTPAPTLPAATQTHTVAVPATAGATEGEQVATVGSEPERGASVTARQAVDALASGDYAAARRLYARLADGTDERAVYAEAARILEARQRARGD